MVWFIIVIRTCLNLQIQIHKQYAKEKRMFSTKTSAGALELVPGRKLENPQTPDAFALTWWRSVEPFQFDGEALMIVAETYFVLLTGQTATWYMEKNISTRHLQHVQPFLGVLNICFNGLTLNLYFTFMHSRFDMTRVCGIYLDLFYQTSQASKSPNTLRTPTTLQQDLAMKAEALKQVDEFWMGWLGWWSESIRGWMVNMVKQST